MSPAPILGLHVDRCIECEHRTSAVTSEALVDAIQAHVDYVNSQLDRVTDIHFELGRLTALVTS